ncbi:hypothetical protein METP2_01291 [Methanosarcinales archaeon]|nr:hypothetical protein METP2_01291 [Methanosarcinales archaeon]
MVIFIIYRKTLTIAKTFVIMSPILFLLLTNGAGATPVKEWSRTYGGELWDEANSVVEIPGEGYIITGSRNIQTTSVNMTDSYDVLLIKTDPDGNEQWNRTYAGKKGMKVSIARDGGYIIRGFNDWDFWLMKTDLLGREEWNRTLRIDNNFMRVAIEETSDGGSILAGGDIILLSESMTISHLWFTKINTNGDQEWNATSKRPQGDMATSVYQTLDGGYVLAGYSGSGNNDIDVLIMKTDAKGNEQWNMTFGNAGEPEGAYSVAQTEDGGYILGGFKLSRRLMGNNYDAWVIKTDEGGNEQWNRIFGGSDEDFVSSVQQASDGGYIFAGYTNRDGDLDAWIIKTDAKGKEKWKKSYDGPEKDKINTVKEVSKNVYLLAGGSESYRAGNIDAWLVKIRETNASTTDSDGLDIKFAPGFEILGAMVSIVILFLLIRKRA